MPNKQTTTTPQAYLDAGVAKANAEAISNAQQTKKWIILPGDFSVPGTLRFISPILAGLLPSFSFSLSLSPLPAPVI